MARSASHGPAIFSYGFRPFFFGAAVFAGLAVPAWVLLFAAEGTAPFLYLPREWHVHEMLFGFLPAVITGFLLTAIPNWTGRPPVKGRPLMLLWALWLAGRLVIAIPWPEPAVSAAIDGAFLVVVAGMVWRIMTVGGHWTLAPMGVLVSLYAGATLLFHWLAFSGAETDLSARMALAVVMLLLAFIGGRVTPNFTRNFVVQERLTERPAPFSRFDVAALALVAMAAIVWAAAPQAPTTGWALIAAGAVHLVRLARWRGWVTWKEPLVLILHVGYGWLAVSLLALGGASLGFGLKATDAVHVLTSGAVGAMTLGVMTRASLGHTGRPLHANALTVAIYVLVNLGAMVRVFGTAAGLPTNLMLGLAAAGWSGAYVLFAVLYGPFLLRPSIDE
jgi:uncharacterized protein involved in response to NO